VVIWVDNHNELVVKIVCLKVGFMVTVVLLGGVNMVG
jgi:hypothetical protein